MAGMQNYLAVLQALTQLPQPGGTPPLAPRPTPTFEPPESVQFPMPEMPPLAPSAPIDRRIIEQYLALLGPAPTPPQQQPVGVLDKVAAALSGISAGFQGQGAQFAASLRAERERPQREFEAKQDRYNQQKFQLGLRGLEVAQSAEEKRQARVQAEADRRFELEVNERARRLGLKDQKELDLFRDSLAAKRDREQNEAQTKLTLMQLDAQDKRLDKEISAADKRLDRQQAFELRMKRMEIAAAAARASQGERIMANIIGPDGKSYGSLPYTQIRFSELGEPQGFPQGTQIRLSTAPAAATGAAGAASTAPAGTPGSTVAGPAVPTTPVSDEEIKQWRGKGISEAFIKTEIQRRGRRAEDEPSREKAREMIQSRGVGGFAPIIR